MLCKTLFHFDGALTKPVEILRKQLLLQEISLNKSAPFRKHIIHILHQKEISHAGSHCKTRNHPFSGILYPGFRGLQGLAGNGSRKSFPTGKSEIRCSSDLFSLKRGTWENRTSSPLFLRQVPGRDRAKRFRWTILFSSRNPIAEHCGLREITDSNRKFQFAVFLFNRDFPKDRTVESKSLHLSDRPVQTDSRTADRGEQWKPAFSFQERPIRTAESHRSICNIRQMKQKDGTALP